MTSSPCATWLQHVTTKKSPKVVRNALVLGHIQNFTSCVKSEKKSSPTSAEAISSAPSSAGRSNGTAPSATRTATARTARTRKRWTKRLFQKPKPPRPARVVKPWVFGHSFHENMKALCFVEIYDIYGNSMSLMGKSSIGIQGYLR